MEDAGATRSQRRRVLSADAVLAAGLDTNKLHLLVLDKGVEHANGVGAAAHAGQHRLGQLADRLEKLGRTE